MLQSISIPPIAGAPFTLTLETEWARPLGTNGGTMTLANRRHIARDATGRIYQERRTLVPKGGKIESVTTTIQLGDPNAHTLYNCFVFEKRCELKTFIGSPTAQYAPQLGTSGPLANGEGELKVEELGKTNVAGMETVGHRETTTLNPGVMGNDQVMTTMREFWYQPQLKISLISLRDDPQTGSQKFRVTEISPTDPDPALFTLPEGFTVVDLRHIEAPSR